MSTGIGGNWGAFVDWRRVAVVAAAAAVPLVALPMLVSEYTTHVMAIAAYYLILAASWNSGESEVSFRNILKLR